MTAGRSLLVIDEAYGEFAPQASLIPELGRVPHLVILRTMSKAAALAGARVGTVIAHPRLIALLRKLIPPYALPAPSIVAALDCLTPAAIAIERERIAQLIAERYRLARALGDLASRSALVRRIWSSDANFLLVEFEDRARAFTRLSAAGLLVRDVGGRAGLGEVLRITVGTRAQNDRVIAHLAGDARDP
jgi:histidinol-phosphate aminotransferase